MHRDGHFGLNILIAAPIVYLIITTLSIELGLYAAAIAIVTARLPDRDGHFDADLEYFQSNWFLHQVPIKHRGIMHTVWFGIFIGALVGFCSIAIPIAGHTDVTKFIIGFGMGTLGVLSHLLGDAMTKMGIQPFQPLSDKRYKLSWFKSRSLFANKGMLCIGVCALILALYFGIGIEGFEEYLVQY
jgi:inner membrane protein